MLEMYMSGISTRKVGQVVETLCGKSLSKSYVSSITNFLDEEVRKFQQRHIDKKIHYMMTDILYIKVRENRRAVSKAVHISIGINSKGFKNIVGFMFNNSESEETWKSFYQSMIDRGLTNVEMVIRDAHQGQIKATQKSFTESVWQRCQVHFSRNVMDKLPKKIPKKSEVKSKNYFALTILMQNELLRIKF